MVSIIIPCFNQAHYLAEAVQSALGQTYRPIEIIVVDDASTDATFEVARRFPEVRYVRQTRNRGLARARTAGLADATGSLVVFLDADDFIYPNSIAVGVSCLTKHPEAAFVFGSFSITSADGSRLRDMNVALDTNDVYAELLVKNVVGMLAAAMFRKRAIEEVGPFDPRVKGCEDYDLMLRLSRLYPVIHHREIVAAYRKHEANMSTNYRLMLKTSVRALRKQRHHTQSNERWKDKYAEGMHSWKSGYGWLLFTQLLNDATIGRPIWTRWVDLLFLVRYVGLSELRTWRRELRALDQRLR